ncbi:uncharacterized aarF domain-containing protein kinase At5g05200, chloroplastic isoform X1 [Gossypium hirsutum]|uniref:Uncharacterized aarF domain-containing protein kinase At5g05200, chloroplastic isoform X1 n=2 Tax=Gossypium hirsutum TaxID=3635 RepID=A0ABM2ZKS3_GOSHI|nr:uncharacterized aarF domain-containing protein kinase At5g05200, chloroplastic-like isoform X1 [Gossypium hirsutum]
MIGVSTSSEFCEGSTKATCVMIWIAQIIGKPNLAPAAWVKRLVTLCDQAPTTPLDDVQLVLEKEFGRSIDEIFENFDVNPLSLASIAHVHRARLRGDKNDVVVKVQHPGIQDLMMTGIHNLQAFALYIQKNDIKFDLFSVAKVMGKHVFVFTLMFLAKHIYPSFMYFPDYVN